VGLGSFPFARHYLGNHCYFLLLRLLRCFSSARSRIIRHAFNMTGCPIRKSPDQFSCADPRGLSQLITSFIASESLGIPRVPLLTFFSGRPFAPARMPYYFVQSASVRKQLNCCCCLLLCFFFQYVKERYGLLSHWVCKPVVENNGFEPLTPCVQGRCSSQLS
jgi:hypothetical protein